MQIAGWGLCALFVLCIAWLELTSFPNDTSGEPAHAFAAHELFDAVSRAQLDSPHTDQFIERLRGIDARGNASELIAGVERAVAGGDRAAMASKLHDLALLSLTGGDLEGAEVWLADARAEYESLGDDRGRARVMLDQGRLHMAFRSRARRASQDYDDLLIARWARSRGHHDQASAVLQRVVASSLDLNRFATAASALTTLFQLELDTGDRVAAFAAGQRALSLHASAGNIHLARRMLDTLEREGLDRTALRSAQRALEAGLEEYQSSVQKLGLVRNYTQLYNQLLSRGDPVSAWRYRRRANDLRRGASERALYRRQADVMVELYRSNSRMERAGAELRDAQSVFARLGMAEEMLQSAALRADIR